MKKLIFMLLALVLCLCACAGEPAAVETTQPQETTAATEALIVGTPVCTVDVSGMKEMLGENNEYGIVTENHEDALYLAVRDLLAHPANLGIYKTRAALRGQAFCTKTTVNAVESMLQTVKEK